MLFTFVFTFGGGGGEYRPFGQQPKLRIKDGPLRYTRPHIVYTKVPPETNGVPSRGRKAYAQEQCVHGEAAASILHHLMPLYRLQLERG